MAENDLAVKRAFSLIYSLAEQGMRGEPFVPWVTDGKLLELIEGQIQVIREFREMENG